MADEPGRGAGRPLSPSTGGDRRNLPIGGTTHGVRVFAPTEGKGYYRLVYYTSTGQRRQASAGRNEAAAIRKAWEIDDELAASIADPSGRLVDQLLDVWLPTVKKGNAASHYGKYASMTTRFIRPMLGGLPAWPLTREQVKAVVDAAEAESTSAGRHTKNALGALLTWAHVNDWVANPHGMFFPRQPRTGKADRGRTHGEKALFIDEKLRPSPAACRALAEAMREVGGTKHGQQLWLMVALASSCGVRQGELFGSLVDALDLARGEWLINRQVVRVKADGSSAETDEEGTSALEHDPDLVVPADPLTRTTLITPPKWGRRRTTALPELTIWGEPLDEPLRAWVATRPAGTLLFPTPRAAAFFHPSNFGRDYLKEARALAAEQWSASWSWHSLRHAYCTALLVAGAQDTDVARAAGHRDSNTTRAMYVGATEGTTSRLNALFRRTPDDEEAA